MSEDVSKLQYPIGKFQPPHPITKQQINEWIDSIANLPKQLRETVRGLSDEQLDTPYRPGGWTARQVVHHLADSHINSYCRFRLALTEQVPIIKPYFEDRWAELPDAKSAPIDISLDLLTALHGRWIMLLKSLTADDFHKTFYHPEHEKEFPLDVNIGIYAWHGEHHVAQIQSIIEHKD